MAPNEAPDDASVVAAMERKMSAAASALRSLPRKPVRMWTGWINGEHCWRGRLVILPDGNLGKVYGALRQKVIVRIDDSVSADGFVDRVFDAQQLRIFKNPAAVELGWAKTGVTERKSELKARTSRANGAAPVRPGSRPRGRPPLPQKHMPSNWAHL